MTKSKLFLRIASGLVLTQSVLHTIGGVFGKPVPGPATAAWTAMQSNHFLVSGLNRTYVDFYVGFGLCITVSLVAEGIVFWLLSNRVSTYAAVVRPMIGAFALGYLGLAVVATLFFFPPPAITDFAICLCLVIAFFQARPDIGRMEGIKMMGRVI